MGEERVVLEDHAEPSGDRLDPRHVLSVHYHASGIGTLEAGKETQRRGLSASARPEQRQHLAALERERETVHGEHAVESLDQALETQELAHRACLPVPRT